MEKANPLLFSQDRVEQYPFQYDELKQFITTKDASGISLPYQQENRYATEGDYLDFLLYRTSDNDTSINLEKKLACEYALYQVQNQKSQGKLPKEIEMSLGDVMKLKANSDEWYKQIMSILETINAIELDTTMFKKANNDIGSSSLMMKDGSHMNIYNNKNVSMLDIHQNESNITVEEIQDNKSTEIVLQELTAYLLSNSIKKGIDVKPSRVDDPVEFLKSGIDSILNETSQSEKLISEARKRSIKRSNTYKNARELETAFEDLQLAHSFLTKQFEHDREEYTRDLEKLTYTNKELQHKVLNYHSSLLASEVNVSNLEVELKDLKESGQSNVSVFSPVSLSSNVSTGLNSISIMRNEFKKMLTDTQRKYEKELDKERNEKEILERELQALKESKI